MADENSKYMSDALVTDILREVKPGFEVVPRSVQSRRPNRPSTSTPDISTLRRKARMMSIGSRTSQPDEAGTRMSSQTDSLMQKYLQKSGEDASQPTSKSRGRIVHVRPIQADSIGEDEPAPKDLTIVVDDKGKLGESS